MAAQALSGNRTFFHLADFLFALEVALSPVSNDNPHQETDAKLFLQLYNHCS